MMNNLLTDDAKRKLRGMFGLEDADIITDEEYKRLDDEQFEQAQDGFFGRVRRCAKCHQPTSFDIKRGRYCPAGCFTQYGDDKR